jgi:DMSO/TMAO reductase YedYZ heme-binding membrane subunit
MKTPTTIDRSHARKLLGLGSLALLTLCSLILIQAPDVDGVRMTIRATARSSLLFFLLAYTAHPLCVLWPGAWTAFLRQHRRQWGLLLVVSHTLHAIAIGALATMAPDLFMTLSPLGNRITGGIAYGVLWSMGATSFDRSARWLGKLWWSRLHTWGLHYLWLSFLIANGKRIPQHAGYAWPTALLLLALGLRLMARASTRRPAVLAGS